MTARHFTGRCPGSGRPGYDGRFPGDSDRCPVCGSQVKVTEWSGLRAHRVNRTYATTGKPINGVR